MGEYRMKFLGLNESGSSVLLALFGLSACADQEGALVQEDKSAVDLRQRAYVVSEESDELFVVDLETMSAVGKVNTTVSLGEVNSNHMAVVSEDASKVYVLATHANHVVVVDAATLTVTHKIEVGAHTTHAALREGSNQLWVVNEDSNSVSIIDTEMDEVIYTIDDPSLRVPHAISFAPNGQEAYIANIQGNQISVIDLESYSVNAVIQPEGMTEVSSCSSDPCGFADVQIDANGVLYAAHIESGRVVILDTMTGERLADVEVGHRPWSVFAANVGDARSQYLAPRLGDGTVALIGARGSVPAQDVHTGHIESYGVNYSPL